MKMEKSLVGNKLFFKASNIVGVVITAIVLLLIINSGSDNIQQKESTKEEIKIPKTLVFPPDVIAKANIILSSMVNDGLIDIGKTSEGSSMIIQAEPSMWRSMTYAQKEGLIKSVQAASGFADVYVYKMGSINKMYAVADVNNISVYK